MWLLGAPIPVHKQFRRLGIGIRVRLVCGTMPMMKKRMERGASVLTRMPQLTTLHLQSTMAGCLAMAITLHGVELADASDMDLARPNLWAGRCGRRAPWDGWRGAAGGSGLFLGSMRC